MKKVILISLVSIFGVLKSYSNYYELDGGTDIEIRNKMAEFNDVGTIAIKGIIDINSNLIIPEGIEVKFFKGGEFKFLNGSEVEFNGVLTAGIQRIFSGDGNIVGVPILSSIYPQWWHDDNHTDWSYSIQKAIELAKTTGNTNVFIPKGEYLVHDLVKIEAINNLTFEMEKGAVLNNPKHGHGILEINDSENISIVGGKYQGEGSHNFLDKDLENPNHTHNTLGGGEKHFTSFSKTIAWGYWRNSNNTALGKHPIIDGYIGNCGIGILVKNGSKDIIIDNVEVEGFNYTGIQIQFLHDPVSEQSNYCKDIIIKNCSIHNIYSAGISVHGAYGCLISNNHIYAIGHPDTDGSEAIVDPGYGITLRGINYENTEAKNIIINQNNIYYCKRKGIDAHSGINFTISNNIIRHCFVNGIGLTGKQGLQGEVIITDNQIYDCGNIRGATGVFCEDLEVPGITHNDGKAAIVSNYDATVISNNQIVNSGYSYGILCQGENSICESNIITYTKPLTGFNPSAIETIGVSRANISNNIIKNSIHSLPCIKTDNDNVLVQNNIVNNVFSSKIEELIFLIEYTGNSSPQITQLDGRADLVDSYIPGGSGEVIIFKEGTKNYSFSPEKQLIGHISFIDKKSADYIALLPGSTGNKLKCAISPRDNSNTVIYSAASEISGLKAILSFKLILY